MSKNFFIINCNTLINNDYYINLMNCAINNILNCDNTNYPLFKIWIKKVINEIRFDNCRQLLLYHNNGVIK